MVPDLIASFHADPLRDRPVLLLLLSEKALDLEGLVRRLIGGRKKWRKKLKPSQAALQGENDT